MFSLNQVQTNNKHKDTLIINNRFLNDKYLEGYNLRFIYKGPPHIIDSIPEGIELVRKSEIIQLK